MPGLFSKRRQAMVQRQLLARGIDSPPVLEAMAKVPREAFLAREQRGAAYADTALPIAAGQTVSQPYIVALMTAALDLKGGETVLEIGTGSGYAAAVLAQIAGQVYSVERIGGLAENAAATLAGLGYANVHVRHDDGTRGWPEHAPYDGITVTACGREVPPALKAQLRIGARLVMPVGASELSQVLICVTRTGRHDYRQTTLADVRFVPLVGGQG